MKVANRSKKKSAAQNTGRACARRTLHSFLIGGSIGPHLGISSMGLTSTSSGSRVMSSISANQPIPLSSTQWCSRRSLLPVGTQPRASNWLRPSSMLLITKAILIGWLARLVMKIILAMWTTFKDRLTEKISCVKSAKIFYCFLWRMSGKSAASRTGRPINTAKFLSDMPKPAVGGMPYSIASI